MYYLDYRHLLKMHICLLSLKVHKTHPLSSVLFCQIQCSNIPPFVRKVKCIFLLNFRPIHLKALSPYKHRAFLFHRRREAKISMCAKYLIPVAEVWRKIGVGLLMVHIVFAGSSVYAKRYQT